MNARFVAHLAAEAAPTFRALRLAPEQVEALARRRLAHLLEWAARTPFHAGRLRRAGLDPGAPVAERDLRGALLALPPVSKQELRAAGDAVLWGGRIDPGWWSSRSSGSTGEPFRVFYDARAWAILKYLVKLRARWACGVHPWHRIAVLDAVPPERPGGSPLERAGRLRTVSVLQPPDRIAAALAAFAPDAVYGLPSALIETAAALDAVGGRVKPMAVFTSGELLQPSARRTLEDAYGCRVFDGYGTSETKEIAWECPEGSLHLNSDVVWAEVLDNRGDPAAPGEEGDIVATLLVNRAMPLVRYRTGDRGSLLAEPCRCGLPFPCLGVVTGRAADTLEMDGRRISPYALTCALETVEGLLRYQVVQVDPAELCVRGQIGPAADRGRVAAEIRTALRAVLGDFVHVGVEWVDRFETGPRAKFRVIQAARPRGVAGADA